MSNSADPEPDTLWDRVLGIPVPLLFIVDRPMPLEPRDATRLLSRIEAGDPSAQEELLPLLYDELRDIAGACMARERSGHTLQPTELVHEAWIRSVGGDDVRHFEGRTHFVRAAARAMRHVLCDHARARAAGKRNEGERAVALDEVLVGFEDHSLDVIELADAIDWLGERDQELARLVELRYFGGLSIAETAKVLGTSDSSVERGWRVARMWLRRALEAGS